MQDNIDNRVVRNIRMRSMILVDWGTSNLRAFLLDGAGKIAAARESTDGILAVRQGGFADCLDRLIGSWLAGEKAPPDILMCGMVGSRHGWIEVPYTPCPAGLAEIAHGLRTIPGNGNIAIVPGLSYRGADGHYDVMRGEETQIIGALAELDCTDADLCLPGTHSKWASVRQGKIMRFQSSLTGELFQLLCEHSTIGRLMPPDSPFSASAFGKGLDQANAGGELLAQLFGIRADALFDVVPASAMRSYLSGLLIGHEIRGQIAGLDRTRPVVLVGADALLEPYAMALAANGLSCHKISVATATVCGLVGIAGRAIARSPG